MLIKEACEHCSLTKKAIEYYEAKGLICPAVLENGYREYGDKEIAALKEISVLRRCGIGIAAIKEILRSANKQAALEKYRYVAQVRRQRFEAIQLCMDGLIRQYDIDQAFHRLNDCGESVYTIKERLALAFPGNYGLFLALHFGRFLNEPIDTQQKNAAYTAILQYLDSIELYLSPELSEFFEAFAAVQEGGGAAELQSQMSENMQTAIMDTERYLEQNREAIAQYLAFRVSDAFKESPMGKMQESLKAFQKASGYQEIFIANMKVLSREYAEYLQRVENANEAFIRQFPLAEQLL